MPVSEALTALAVETGAGWVTIVRGEPKTAKQFAEQVEFRVEHGPDDYDVVTAPVTWAQVQEVMNRPPPPDPQAELDAALAQVQTTLAGVSTLIGLKTALDDTLDAMRGKAGRAGRIAGRPL